MNHACPHCEKRNFTFRQIVSASTFHGTTCKDCNTQVRLPLWARVMPALPIWLWLVWEIATRPPAIPEYYGLMSALVLTVLLVLATLFFIQLERKSSTKPQPS